MLPRVLIAAPVRNRAWALPRYLDAIVRLDYPADRLALYWLVNDCQDDTMQVLETWQSILEPMGYEFVSIDTQHAGRVDREYRGAVRLAGPRRAAYPVLANLRNRIREVALAHEFDYLLSVDSDILVQLDTLKRLLRHRRDVVAALVRNGEGAWNYLHMHPERDEFTRSGPPTPGRLMWVGLTGACCLYSRRALEAGLWRACTTGEDEGFARYMLAAGIDQWVDGGHELEHLMEEPEPSWA